MQNANTWSSKISGTDALTHTNYRVDDLAPSGVADAYPTLFTPIFLVIAQARTTPGCSENEMKLIDLVVVVVVRLVLELLVRPLV